MFHLFLLGLIVLSNAYEYEDDLEDYEFDDDEYELEDFDEDDDEYELEDDDDEEDDDDDDEEEEEDEEEDDDDDYQNIPPLKRNSYNANRRKMFPERKQNVNNKAFNGKLKKAQTTKAQVPKSKTTPKGSNSVTDQSFVTDIAKRLNIQDKVNQGLYETFSVFQ